MSTLVVDTLTNQEPQLCKAWVNFNGTGTVAIRASYNVSSITDNGTGNYTVNFNTAMTDTDYCVTGSNMPDGTSGGIQVLFITGNISYSKTVNTVPIKVYSSDATLLDSSAVNVAVFR